MQKGLFILVLVLNSLAYSNELPRDLVQIINNIDTNKIKEHIHYLASDQLEGRGTGTLGGELAASYLAEQLGKLNIQPAGSFNSYFQYIPMISSKLTDESSLKIYIDSIEYELEAKSDYFTFRTGEQTFIPKPVPLVFAGYGIVAPEYDYNDFQTINVEGKIVICIGGEPKSNDPNFFNGAKFTIHSLPEKKYLNALSRGAKGFIYIPNFPDDLYFSWKSISQTYSFDDLSLAYRPASNFGIIINPDIANILFENTAYTFQDIQTLHQNNKIYSFDLKVLLSFSGKFIERTFVTSNIIGKIEGRNKSIKDEYIIVSAHYDHLGIGPAIDGDSIYNGALDNAIGVAALLEIARLLNQIRDNIQRTIIFILLTGEEKGLLGSTYYIDHPIVPLYKTIANINIDGLSFIDEVNSFIAIGKEYSNLGNILEKILDKMNLKLVDLPSEYIQSISFLQSDQYSFAKAGIPSLLIIESTDYKNIEQKIGIEKFYNYITNIYHSPKDDLNQDINFDAVTQHVKVILSLVYYLSTQNIKVEWFQDSPFLKQRLRTQAEKK